MATVHLIGWDNQSGLSRDAALVQEILEGAGHEVVRGAVHLGGRASRLRTRVAGLGRARFDLNLFLESVEPAWLGHARRNAVIPNPEWWGWPTALLRRLDRVFCKSHSAVHWLSHHGARCEWIGFTSTDQFDPDRPPAGEGALHPLHVAGSSHQKGTAALVEVWAAHPAWPRLTVVAYRHPGHPAANWNRDNVLHLDQRLEPAALRRLQNQAGLHLCPSEAEGYGHTLAEGMSCGAIVVTNDLAPMNELVTPERGVLVPVAGVEPMRLGFRARIDPTALAAAIERALALGAETRQALGRAARRWFLANQAEFPARLLAAVEEVLR